MLMTLAMTEEAKQGKKGLRFLALLARQRQSKETVDLSFLTLRLQLWSKSLSMH